MKLLVNILIFLIIISCSGENTLGESSSTKLATDNIKKESNMLGIFGKTAEKYVISSPLAGTLVKGGIPLANTKIIRRLRWNNNDDGVVDEFITDENGYFSIPAYEKTLTLGKLTQFVSNIELFAGSESDENFFWYSNKFSGEIFSDFEAPLQGVVCDIQKKEQRIELKHGAIFSKCHW
jgi:hypothetical protein